METKYKYKKHITVFTVLCFCVFNSFSQNASCKWVKQIGASLTELGYAITTDASGNVYTLGQFQGTVNFDPGASNYTMLSGTIFISKHDSTGNFVWAKQIVNGLSIKGNAIKIDNSGNVYVTGTFLGTVDFDPGSSTYTMTASNDFHDAFLHDDIFILKLDSLGNFIWADQFTGPYDDSSTGITTDAFGNIYVTGGFDNTVDFDPGPAVYNLTAIGDIFVAKLSPSGNLLWVKQMGGAQSETSRSIALDPLGNVYTCGNFSGISDFDPGITTFTLSALGSMDGFVSKLDNNGNFVFAKSFVGSGFATNYGLSITVDAIGNSITSGRLANTCNYDPGVSNYTLSNYGGSDIFIMKLDPVGNFVWVKQMGGIDDDNLMSTALDASGNIYSTGYFQGSADFDPSLGIYILTTSTLLYNSFVSKLDASGNFVWAKQFKCRNLCESNSIAIDNNSNIYTTGYFKDTCNFDPNGGSFNLISKGQSDVFIHKLSKGLFAGVNEIPQMQNEIKIYPNPSSNNIHIETYGSDFENSKIEIENVLEQAVLVRNYSATIDVSELSQGFYTLKIITTNKQVYFSKFLKQ